MKIKQLAQGAEKEAISIAQAYAAYEQLMDESRGYCQQARKLREQAAELQQSERTGFQVRGLEKRFSSCLTEWSIWMR